MAALKQFAKLTRRCNHMLCDVIKNHDFHHKILNKSIDLRFKSAFTKNSSTN
jgi:hypothetical protein